MTRRILPLLAGIFLAVALFLGGAGVAHAASGGGDFGGSGSFGDKGSGSGSGWFVMKDIAGAGNPAWPNTLETPDGKNTIVRTKFCPDLDAFFWKARSGANMWKDVWDRSYESGRTRCAQRIAASTMGMPQKFWDPAQFGMYARFQSICDWHEMPKPGKPIPPALNRVCWTSVDDSRSSVGSGNGGDGTWQGEFHIPSRFDRTWSWYPRGKATAWSIRVWRLETKPDPDGKLRISRIPVFERTQTVCRPLAGGGCQLNTVSENRSPRSSGPSFDGGTVNGCGNGSASAAYASLANDGCVSELEWWRGGDSWSGSSYYDSPTSMHAGPISTKTPQDSERSNCTNDWRIDPAGSVQSGRSETLGLAVPRRINNTWYRSPLMNPAVSRSMSLSAYATSSYDALSGRMRTVPSLTGVCYWTTAAAREQRTWKNRNGNTFNWYDSVDRRMELAVTPAYRESIAVGWTPNTLYYRLQGQLGGLYVVQIALVDAREDILGQRVEAFFAPGPVACLSSTCDPPQLHTQPEPTTDKEEFGTVPVQGVDQVPFPEPSIMLSAPRSLATGQAGTWTVRAANEDGALDLYQALWPARLTLSLTDPRLQDASGRFSWSSCTNSNVFRCVDLGGLAPYRQVRTRSTDDGLETTIDVDFTLSTFNDDFALPIYDSAAASWQMQENPFDQLESGLLGDVGFRAGWKRPSPSDLDPVLAEARFDFIAGRYLDSVGSPRLGVANEDIGGGTRRMPLATSAIGGFFVNHQGDCGDYRETQNLPVSVTSSKDVNWNPAVGLSQITSFNAFYAGRPAYPKPYPKVSIPPVITVYQDTKRAYGAWLHATAGAWWTTTAIDPQAGIKYQWQYSADSSFPESSMTDFGSDSAFVRLPQAAAGKYVRVRILTRNSHGWATNFQRGYLYEPNSTTLAKVEDNPLCHSVMLTSNAPGRIVNAVLFDRESGEYVSQNLNPVRSGTTTLFTLPNDTLPDGVYAVAVNISGVGATANDIFSLSQWWAGDLNDRWEFLPLQTLVSGRVETLLYGNQPTQ